jgi:hypothetical protein
MSGAWVQPEDELLKELGSSEKGFSSLETDLRWEQDQDKERAKLLTSITHPDHRENLEREFYERYK